MAEIKKLKSISLALETEDAIAQELLKSPFSAEHIRAAAKIVAGMTIYNRLGWEHFLEAFNPESYSREAMMRYGTARYQQGRADERAEQSTAREAITEDIRESIRLLRRVAELEEGTEAMQKEMCYMQDRIDRLTVKLDGLEAENEHLRQQLEPRKKAS